jgi:hypothetical protein
MSLMNFSDFRKYRYFNGFHRWTLREDYRLETVVISSS